MNLAKISIFVIILLALTTTVQSANEVNSTDANGSGINIESLGLSFGDLVLVDINTPTPILGSVSVGGNAETSSSTSTTPGSAIGGSVLKSGSGETLFTTETLIIVRGNEEATPIVISNLFENSVLKNIQLSLQGFLSQYITIEPQDQLQRNVDVKLNLNEEIKILTHGCIFFKKWRLYRYNFDYIENPGFKIKMFNYTTFLSYNGINNYIFN